MSYYWAKVSNLSFQLAVSSFLAVTLPLAPFHRVTVGHPLSGNFTLLISLGTSG